MSGAGAITANSPNIVKIFGEIEAAVNQEDHQRILALANQILSEIPDDKDALYLKAVALMKTGKFPEALKVLPESLPFERAYCLYRTGKLAEALAVIKAAGSTEPKFAYLAAQVNYKLENFAESASILEGVLKKADLEGSFRLEVMTNFVAAKAAALQKLDLADKDLKSTFEVAFNAAFFCIQQGDLVSAESFLICAEGLCKESAQEEGLEEEDLLNELAPIQVQLGFVRQQLGKLEAATEIYDSVLKSKVGDEAVRAVASNNVASIQQDHQLFDSSKKLKAAGGEAALQKLLSSQRRAIAFNSALLHLYTHKYQQCQEDVKALLKEYPDSEVPYLILASITLQEKKLPKAIEELESFRGKVPNATLIPLTLAQLYLSQDNVEKATGALESIGNLEKSPLVVALLVLCYERLGKLDQAFSLLDKLSATQNSIILEFNASFHLKHKRGKEAASIYEKLVKNDPKNVKAVSGLIKAYSYFDPSLAEKYEASLPSLPSVSVEALESLISKLSYKSFKSLSKDEAQKDAPNAKKKSGNKDNKEKKRRKRKRVPPKDPTAPIDPERWIPLKYRSYTKKKKSKKEMGKGAAQGAVIAPNLAPPTASTSAASSASAESKPQGAGKKKGKGKA